MTWSCATLHLRVLNMLAHGLFAWSTWVQGRCEHEELDHVEVIEVSLPRGDDVEPSILFFYLPHVREHVSLFLIFSFLQTQS